jgi:inner membrane protein involved in colicin E2 resistance
MRLLWVRVVLLALGGLLGLVLIARGALLIGGIILAMAALRAVMLVSIVRRRDRFRAARAARRSRANVT